MSSNPPIPPDDDDALADALADAWIERAATDPVIRRAALRAAGLLKEPADMTLAELAKKHGTDRRTLYRIARSALRRLRYLPEFSHIQKP